MNIIQKYFNSKNRKKARLFDKWIDETMIQYQKQREEFITNSIKSKDNSEKHYFNNLSRLMGQSIYCFQEVRKQFRKYYSNDV